MTRQKLVNILKQHPHTMKKASRLYSSKLPVRAIAWESITYMWQGMGINKGEMVKVLECKYPKDNKKFRGKVGEVGSPYVGSGDAICVYFSSDKAEEKICWATEIQKL